MSFYFIANNLHFALELIGALIFFVMAWLSVDAYLVSRHYSTVMKILGFTFVGVWQVIYAFNFGGDLVNFIGFFIFLIGLVLLISSFLTSPSLAAVSAIVLIPSFINTVSFLEIFAIVLLGIISFLVYRQSTKEFNVSLKPLYFGFSFLTVAALAQTFTGAQSSDSIFWYVTFIFELIGFISFTFWVWQYLKLRVRESLVLIFISMTLFIATIVTLAFSTILISKIEQETRDNLLINSKVFDFSVQNLTQEAQAEAKLVSADVSVINSLSDNNIPLLQTTLTSYLDSEKLGFLLTIDKNGIVLMRAHSPLEHGDSIVTERAVEEALIGNNFSTIEFSQAEKFSIRASSPVYKNGKIVGAVLAGFPLDNVMVDRIKKITGLGTTLYQDDMAIATTTLGEDGRSRLTGFPIEDASVKDNVLFRGENTTARVLIKNIPYLASYLPIKNGDGKIVGMFSASKPQADIITMANATNRLTLITVTVLLLLLAFPIFILTRRLFGGI